MINFTNWVVNREGLREGLKQPLEYVERPQDPEPETDVSPGQKPLPG